MQSPAMVNGAFCFMVCYISVCTAVAPSNTAMFPGGTLLVGTSCVQVCRVMQNMYFMSSTAPMNFLALQHTIDLSTI